MQTYVLIAEQDNIEEIASTAAEVLTAGGVVALPTETVYGLAANAFDDDAVKSIFEIKGRPQDNPLIVHISDYIMLNDVVTDVSEGALELAKHFWPGPLTMVLKRTEAVSDTVTCGLDTVAVRMPEHPVAAAVIKAAGVPLAAPSANLSGKPSPTTAQHCIDDLTGKVPLIIDGGPCSVGVESTVISMVGDHPILLRPGIISIEDIREILPDAEVSPAVLEELKEGDEVLSPGMKYKHYSPKAEVYMVEGELSKFADYVAEHAGYGVFAMCFDGEEEIIPIPSISYGAEGNGAAQARKLFSVLRAVDDIGAATVYVRAPEEKGVSMAVFNRLIRAAGFKVIQL